MLVICCGINRSGSTWSYQVARKLLGEEAKDLGYLTPAQFEESFPTINAFKGNQIVKMHTDSKFLEKFQGELKLIYTHRDLRGTIVSLMQKESKNFANYTDFFNKGVANFKAWKALGDIVYIPYSDIVSQSERSVRQIAHFIGMEPAAERDKKVAEFFSISNQKKRITDYKSKPSNRFKVALSKVGLARNVKDEKTLLHLRHINNYQEDYWKEVITVKQSESILSKYEEWMHFFNYK